MLLLTEAPAVAFQQIFQPAHLDKLLNLIILFSVLNAFQNCDTTHI